MHYIRFGRGSKNLSMLPGRGDGLTTVKGTALPMAFMYQHLKVMPGCRNRRRG